MRQVNLVATKMASERYSFSLTTFRTKIDETLTVPKVPVSEPADFGAPIPEPDQESIPATSFIKNVAKKRHLREDWKTVENNTGATNDRQTNLMLDPNSDWGMWCKVCTDTAPRLGLKFCTNFVKGHHNFRPPQRKRETVDSHFSSSSHAACVIKARTLQQPKEETPVVKALTKLDIETQKKMENLFRIVFASVMKDRPASDFSYECELQRLNGVPLGSTYQNRPSFNLLLSYVAGGFAKTVTQNINASKYIAVLTDGSTSRNVREYEGVMVRYVSEDADPLIKLEFVGISEVEGSPDAKGLFAAINKCFKNINIANWQDKVVSSTVDGASVNVGKHNGLITQFDTPTFVHCFNHVIDLVLKDTLSQNSDAQAIISLIKSIAHFYRNSPKLYREFRETAEAMNERILSFKLICETRWADSLEAAVKPLIRNYSVLITHLESVVSPLSKHRSQIKSSAKGLLNELQVESTVNFVHRFLDYVAVMSACSVALEKSTITIPEAHSALRKLKLDLLDLKEENGPLSKNTKQYLSAVVEKENTTSVIFNDVLLRSKKKRGNVTALSSSKDKMGALLSLTAANLEERLEKQASCVKTMIDMARILDVSLMHVPDSDDAQESSRVLDAKASIIVKMCSLFNLNSTRALAEWSELCDILVTLPNKTSLINLLKKLRSDTLKHLQVFHDIVLILLTVSPSNAHIERLWSSMGNSLDDKNECMSSKHLEYRLRVKYSKIPLSDYVPLDTVKMWWNDSVRGRRPNVNDDN